MSEWAYRNCKCGNRIHINFTCEKCNGDPWNERVKITNRMNELKSERKRLNKEIKEYTKAIIAEKQRLERSFHVL